MNRIGVIGAGAMGSGIAQVAAMSGCEVMVYDSNSLSIIKSRDSILSSLNKLAARGKITDVESKAIFGRLYFADRLESIAGSHLIIEAIVESLEEKRNLFYKIKPLVHPDTIVASNTSSFSITLLARETSHPHHFIGLHFFNPPVLMPLVEIIPALQTSPNLVPKMADLMKQWEKMPVIAKDTPGFIVNRIARPFYGEALRIAEEQLATPAEIDAAMKTFGGFRMGPFELMDFIGQDVNYTVTHSVWTSMYYDARYKPSPLQASMVNAGWLGRKTGRGFYHYAEASEPANGKAPDAHKFIFDRILAMLINEAADAVYLGIASRPDIETAMTLGVNYPKGLLQWADELGIVNCVQQLDSLYSMYNEDRYRCSRLLREMAQARQTFFA